MNTTLKLLVYCRVSSQEQRKNETIERQLERIPVELKRLGLLKEDGGQYEIYSRSLLLNERDPRKVYFVDDGFNLESITEETALFEAIQLIKAGEIHGIFVDTTDRLLRSRSAEIRGRIQDLLDLHEVKVFNYYGEVPRGILLEILSAFGSEDKKAIGRKLQGGKILKTKNLGAPASGCPPYGYDWDKRKKEWRIVEDEARVLRWIVAATAGTTCVELPESLRILIDQHPDGVPDPELIIALKDLGINKLGFYERCNRQQYIKRNPSGEITRNWIHGLLRENHYCGVKRYFYRDPSLVGRGKIDRAKKEEVVVNLPPILTQAQWDAAQVARNKRARLHGKHVRHQYLLEKVASCASCGGAMSARYSSNKKWNIAEKSVKEYFSLYYTCGNTAKHVPNPCASRRTHNARTIEPIVWEKVVDYIKNPEFVLANEKVLREDQTLQKVLAGLHDDLLLVEKNLRQNKEESMRQLKLLSKNILTEEEFLSLKHESQIEKLRLERTKLKIKGEIRQKEKLLAEVDSVDLSMIQKRYTERLSVLTFDEKRAILLTVVKQVIVSADNKIALSFKL